MHLHTLNPSNIRRASEHRAKKNEREVNCEKPFEPLVPVQGISRVGRGEVDGVGVEKSSFAKIVWLDFGDRSANGTSETAGEGASETIFEGRERGTWDVVMSGDGERFRFDERVWLTGGL